MGAVFLRLRSEVRHRWTGWLALALIVGLTAGAAIAAAAGARRAQTSYRRLLVTHRAADVVTGGFAEAVDVDAAVARIERLPIVEESTRLATVGFAVETMDGEQLAFPSVVAQVDPSGRFGIEFNRFKILDGRVFRRDAPDEAVAGFIVAERLGLRLGDRVNVVVGDPADPAQKKRIPVRVVGIGAMPGDFPSVGVTMYPGFYPSPGFYRANAQVLPAADSLAIRFRGGPGGISAFAQQLDELGLRPDLILQSQLSAGVERTTRFEAGALWILAGLIALVAAAILLQSLARQALLEAGEYPSLRAIGMSRSQLFALGMARSVAIGIVGAATAAGVAVLLSPFTPIGMARIAEPDPGFAVDGLVLALGAGAALLVVSAISVIPAWRAVSVKGDGAAWALAAGGRPSTIASTFARVHGSPAATTGVRLALESGRGSTALPVRSTILGATLALAALAASLAFGKSLDHTLDTPELSGFTYQAFLAGSVQQERPLGSILRSEPRVEAFTRGGFVNLRIGGPPVFGFVYQPEGSVLPAILDGRAPSSPDEIALAPNTMRHVHAGIGDRVRVIPETDSGPGRPRMFRVVGKAVTPPAPFGVAAPGEGAALTLEGYLRLDPAAGQSTEESIPFLVRFRPKVDPAVAVETIQRALERRTGGRAFSILSQRPGDLTSLGRIASVPNLLGVLMAVVAVATLAHTLATSIRRRRRDLAILKTLGFVRGQVSATVGWQATMLVGVAVVLGIPLGVAVGRWGWTLYADRLGIVAEPVVPLLTTLLLLPAAIVAANLIALAPGRIAARTQPGVVLRTE